MRWTITYEPACQCQPESPGLAKGKNFDALCGVSCTKCKQRYKEVLIGELEEEKK